MAAAIVSSCITEPVKVVGKWFGEQIIAQLTFLWCFDNNIKSLRDEAKVLDSATKGLQLQVDEATDNGEIPGPEVVIWIEMSKDIQDQASKILGEATNVESDVWKLGDRLSVSKRTKEMTDRAKDHRNQKKFSVILHQRPSPAKRIVRRGKTFEFKSRNKIEEEIMTTLRGGDVDMLGICGMGGLGKTTMAEKIRNRALEGNIFKEVVMVVVSHNVDIWKVQEEIGRQLRLEKLKDEKLKENERIDMLHYRLSDDTNRTLLVLDDIWEKPPLDSIGIPSDSKWCTILFTSRNRDVLHDMDVKIFGMEVLSKEEAWPFFRERAGTCVDDTELNPIAKQVVEECGGLPINLAAVGAVLKHKSIGIWRDLLRKLKKSVPNTVQYEKSCKPLKLSYEYLNSKEAQSIFLLCCLFPEDTHIPLDFLTYFCMGLRLFQEDITKMQEATDKMCALTEFLKDRSLLLESDKKDCVRMHDVVRDVCISIAKEEEYIDKDGCTWISSSHLVGEGNKLLSGSRFPNLRLLFLESRYDDSLGFKFDVAFLEGMSKINVFCIEEYHSLTTLLRPTMQSLATLHTLILDACKELKTISAVGELVNLEILICRHCTSIEELPSEMKRLNQLKLLDLTYCSKLQSIGRGIIARLVGLEEMKMYGSFYRWEAEDREERENASIKELEALPNLACLEIDIQDHSLLMENMPRLSEKIDRFKVRTNFLSIPSEFSKGMCLYLERETRFGDWIEMQLMRDTKYLYLRGDDANNVELERRESMKSLVRTSGGDDASVFPSIEYLKLEYLPELQKICDGPISSTSFQNLNTLRLNALRELTQFWKSSSVCENINCVPHFTSLSSIDISFCDKLCNLGQLSIAGKDCLPHLQKLHILRCKMMEHVFLWSKEEEAGKNITSILITKVFPKLKEVKLDDLPNLIAFYQGIQGIEFPLLTELQIQDCPKMKSIIERCSSAEIDEDGYLHLFCQPKKIAFGSSYKILEMDHNPFCAHEISSSLFNGLKQLTISKCAGSMRLFTLSVAAHLVSLRQLCIKNCDEIIKVIEDEQQHKSILLFPKLKKLYLEKLPKLVSFCDSKCEVEFPSLRQVEIYNCPNMKSFSLGLVATPNVEAFTTDLTTYVGVGVGVDVEFNSLKKLKISKNENPLNDDKISVSLFSRLEKLEFYMHLGTMSLFSSSAVRNLVNLRVLNIESCYWIVKVIEDEEEEDHEKVGSGGEIRTVVFPKLEVLRLDWLPKSVRFSEWKCDVELPSLTQVEIRGCPNMESFSMGSVAAPNLKIVLIDWEEIDATKDLNVALQQSYLARPEKEEQEETGPCNMM